MFSTLRLGTKSFKFNVTVENKGADPAYTVSLMIRLQTGLQLDQVTYANNVSNHFVDFL